MNNRYFQWVAGDQRGTVLLFDKMEYDEENNYIVFKNGSRINENLVAQLNETDLTNKYMVEVDSIENIWKFSEEYIGRQEEMWEKNADGVEVCVAPFIPGKKVINLIPPKPTPKVIYTESNNNSQNFIAQKEECNNVKIDETNKIDKLDPIYILISKSKKFENDINMTMTVSLPQKSLYNISKTSFENGDTKFVDYIVDEIDIKEIKESIKQALKEMYEDEHNE